MNEIVRGHWNTKRLQVVTVLLEIKRVILLRLNCINGQSIVTDKIVVVCNRWLLSFLSAILKERVTDDAREKRVQVACHEHNHGLEFSVVRLANKRTHVAFQPQDLG